MVRGGDLIGRERELAELERLIETARLVTITGPGGCGKTRVAHELAGRAGAGSGGVEAITVQLAGASGAEGIVGALLRAVGGRERFGRRPVQVLVEAAAGRHLLLVLDDCEQLVVPLGAVLADLLRAAEGVRVVVTSREPLGIPDESVFRLGALSLPEPGGGVGGVVRSDAGRLFVDRAALLEPDWALTPETAAAVIRICRELDGLPLALCLAAARVDPMSVDDVAEELARRGRLHAAGDDSPRHRSLRASLDWSYGLLDGHERVILSRLAVFAGGFDAAAARAVSASPLAEPDVHEILLSLESKGLIMPMPSKAGRRWTLLQTIREYGARQLRLEAEADAAADRHLSFFATFAAEADDRLLDPLVRERLDEEAANLRRALDHALERDVDRAVGLAASLVRYWILAERFEEARDRCAAVISAAGGIGEPGGRAVVHCGAALVGVLGGDGAAAVAHMQAGLTLLTGVDDPEVECRCLLMTAMVQIQAGLDLESGRECARRARELALLCGDVVSLAWAVVNLAVVEAITDRFDAARAAYEEFLTIPNAGEHLRLRTWAEVAAAWTQLIAGSPERALAHADLGLALEGGAPSMTHFQLQGFRIHALALAGRLDAALADGARELERARETGALQAVPALELALVVAELHAGRLDAVDERAARLLEVPQLHTVALVREVLARAALVRGDARQAAAHAAELQTIAGAGRSERCGAVAQLASGCALVLDGNVDGGRDVLQAGLAAVTQLGLERDVAAALTALALLTADAGDSPRAARLAGAASAAQARLGYVPDRFTVDALAARRDACIEGDGASTWDGAWAEGAQLSLAEAVAYARRGRGRRDRPPAGWGSLTPAELDVAALAASGLSNPQIAARLFVSRATVKMHLSNVYLKLHVANRTELAGAMATQSAHQAAELRG